MQNDELKLAYGKADERAVLLECALRELETFSYSVSHDLRAPLRHINSYLTILSDDFGNSLCSDARLLLDKATSATVRMGRLIDDLLELARLGRGKLEKSPLDLSALAHQVCDSLYQTDPGRSVRFRISAGLVARGDSGLVSQLLWNLLENAWKYTARNPNACIEVGSELSDGSESFYVRDNGVGFDERYKEKLFGVFERLHGEEFQGNGIGLANVKRIVDGHGGKLWAESTLGEGATFHFTLP